MRILVTGATGFVGAQASLELLRQGHEVVALGRSKEKLGLLVNAAGETKERLTTLSGDLRQMNAFPEEIEAVVHAAAIRIKECEKNPAVAMEINVGGTARVLSWANAVRVKKFLLLSTQAIYGNRPTPWHENDPPSPSGIYGLSKYAAECLSLAAGGDLDVGVFRLSKVYGTGLFMTEELVFTFVRRAIAGEAIEIHGNGSQRVDLVHVRDVARCIRLFLEHPQRLPFSVFNVGGGNSITVRDLAELVLSQAKALGYHHAWFQSRPDIHPKHPGHLELDTSRIYNALGWSPFVDREEAVRIYFASFYHGSRVENAENPAEPASAGPSSNT